MTFWPAFTIAVSIFTTLGSIGLLVYAVMFYGRSRS